MRTLLLLISLLLIRSFCFAQLTTFSPCPVNLSATAGFVYHEMFGSTDLSYISSDSGTRTKLISMGPVSPNDDHFLDLDGIGINTVDSFLYGLLYADDAEVLYAGTTNTFPYMINRAFYRLGANGVNQLLGDISTPPLTGADNTSIVKCDAGDMDLADNFYFTACTGVFTNIPSGPTRGTFITDKLFLGKMSNVSVIPAFTDYMSYNPLPASYTEITNPSNDAIGFLTRLKGIFVGPFQSVGLHDFAFNASDSTLYSYVTYPDSANNVMGQMLKLNPVTGVISAVAPPLNIGLPLFITDTSTLYNGLPQYITDSAVTDVIGCSFDKDGNFIIMFSNQSIYKAVKTAGIFDGSILLLSNSSYYPGLYGIHGDMTSCAKTYTSIPITPTASDTINSFSVLKENAGVDISWQMRSEINTEKFIIQKTTDSTNWANLVEIPATGDSSLYDQYQYLDTSTLDSITYYRIAIVSRTGSFNYSETKEIEVNLNNLPVTSTASFKNYPNPVGDVLTITSPQTLAAGTTTITISDTEGRPVNSSIVTVQNGVLEVSVAALKTGIYIISILNGSTIKTMEFIKQ